MTTLPTEPDHLLSLAEWDALPEDASRRLELVEGAVVVSPSPQSLHQWLAKKLGAAMDEVLNPEWEALADVLVVVEVLYPSSGPRDRLTKLGQYELARFSLAGRPVAVDLTRLVR